MHRLISFRTNNEIVEFESDKAISVLKWIVVVSKGSLLRSIIRQAPISIVTLYNKQEKMR